MRGASEFCGSSSNRVPEHGLPQSHACGRLSCDEIWDYERQLAELIRVQNVTRGDIFYANLNPVIGSEQEGVRPVLILQNDIGNKYSPTTIVAAIIPD